MSIYLRHKQGQERRIKKGFPALTEDCPLLETDFIGPCHTGFLHTVQIYTLPKKNVYPANFNRTCPDLLCVNTYTSVSIYAQNLRFCVITVNLISVYSEILIVSTI